MTLSRRSGRFAVFGGIRCPRSPTIERLRKTNHAVRYCVCWAGSRRASCRPYLHSMESSRDQHDRFSRLVRARHSRRGCDGRFLPDAAIRVAGRVTAMSAALVKLRNLAPYALLTLILPGGSVVAFLLWLHRRQRGAAAPRGATPTT
jgi:hypothetical protein